MGKIKEVPQQARRGDTPEVAGSPCATTVEMTATETGANAAAARAAAQVSARAAAADACFGKTCNTGICRYVEKRIVGNVVQITPPPAAGMPTHSATYVSSGDCQCS